MLCWGIARSKCRNRRAGPRATLGRHRGATDRSLPPRPQSLDRWGNPVVTGCLDERYSQAIFAKGHVVDSIAVRMQNLARERTRSPDIFDFCLQMTLLTEEDRLWAEGSQARESGDFVVSPAPKRCTSSVWVRQRREKVACALPGQLPLWSNDRACAVWCRVVARTVE